MAISDGYSTEYLAWLRSRQGPAPYPWIAGGSHRVSGSIYFLGKYRPAHFEADSVFLVSQKMLRAIRFLDETDLRLWLSVRIEYGREQLSGNTAAWQADHCDRGVSFAKRPRDPFLDRVTADMPLCPGLDYSAACNAPA